MGRLLIITLLFVSMLFGCSSGTQKSETSQDETVESKWSAEEIDQFKSDCQQLASELHDEGDEIYCDCLFKEVNNQFPEHNETHELSQAQWINLIVNSDCHDDKFMEDYGSGWDEASSQAYLEGCKTAKMADGVAGPEADSFCACTLEKLKSLIPNPQYSTEVTEEELSEILASCN